MLLVGCWFKPDVPVEESAGNTLVKWRQLRAMYRLITPSWFALKLPTEKGSSFMRIVPERSSSPGRELVHVLRMLSSNATPLYYFKHYQNTLNKGA